MLPRGRCIRAAALPYIVLVCTSGGTSLLLYQGTDNLLLLLLFFSFFFSFPLPFLSSFFNKTLFLSPTHVLPLLYPRLPFLQIFDPSATQLDVYDEVCAPAVMDVLQGYNSTVFAYGKYQVKSKSIYYCTGHPGLPHAGQALVEASAIRIHSRVRSTLPQRLPIPQFMLTRSNFDDRHPSFASSIPCRANWFG